MTIWHVIIGIVVTISLANWFIRYVTRGEDIFNIDQKRPRYVPRNRTSGNWSGKAFPPQIMTEEGKRPLPPSPPPLANYLDAPEDALKDMILQEYDNNPAILESLTVFINELKGKK